MSGWVDYLLLRPGLTSKIFFGLILIAALLVWRFSARSDMRRQVHQDLEALCAFPPTTESGYLADPMKYGRAEEGMVAIYRLGEEAVPLLFEEMEKSPKTRAWGLLSQILFPVGVSNGRDAPSLDLLVKWLDDPDPVVAANASQNLRGLIEVQDELAGEGPAPPKLKIGTNPTREERDAGEAEYRRDFAVWVKWWVGHRKFIWRSMEGRWMPEK